MDGLMMPSDEVMKQIEGTGYKYLEILEIDKFMEKGMTEQLNFDNLRKLRVKLRYQSKLKEQKQIAAINIWVASPLR